MADLTFFIGNVLVENIIAFMLWSIAVLFAAYLCYKAVKQILFRYTSRSFARWTARFAGYIILVVGIYYADLIFLGFDVKATLASLGIISIALAFASQQIVSSLLAGILITVNRTIALDDWIEVGGDPATGISQVKDITFTRTILRDRDGRVYILPNATLLGSKIVNYSKSGFVEIPLSITLPASVPFDRAAEEILAVIRAHPDILPGGSAAIPQKNNGFADSFFIQGYTRTRKDPSSLSPRVLFTGITHQGNVISIRFWVQDISKGEDISSSVLAEISRRIPAVTDP